MARCVHFKNKIIIINTSKCLHGAHHCWNYFLKNKNKNEKIKSYFIPELCPRLIHFCHIFKKVNVLDSKGRKEKQNKTNKKTKNCKNCYASLDYKEILVFYLKLVYFNGLGQYCFKWFPQITYLGKTKSFWLSGIISVAKVLLSALLYRHHNYLIYLNLRPKKQVSILLNYAQLCSNKQFMDKCVELNGFAYISISEDSN